MMMMEMMMMEMMMIMMIMIMIMIMMEMMIMIMIMIMIMMEMMMMMMMMMRRTAIGRNNGVEEWNNLFLRNDQVNFNSSSFLLPFAHLAPTSPHPPPPS